MNQENRFYMNQENRFSMRSCFLPALVGKSTGMKVLKKKAMTGVPFLPVAVIEFQF
jgi:hypothetical protein